VEQPEGLQADGLQPEGLQADALQPEGLQADGLQAEGLQGKGFRNFPTPTWSSSGLGHEGLQGDCPAQHQSASAVALNRLQQKFAQVAGFAE